MKDLLLIVAAGAAIGVATAGLTALSIYIARRIR